MAGNFSGGIQINTSNYTSETSCIVASSDLFGTQILPISELTDCYNYSVNHNNNPDYNPPNELPNQDSFNQGLDFNNSNWMDCGDFWNMDDSVFVRATAGPKKPPPPPPPRISVVGVGGLEKPPSANQPTDGQIFTDIGSFTSLMSSSEDLENMLGFNMVGVSTSLAWLQQSEQASITENPSPAITVPSFASGYLDQTVHQFEFTE
ncbi:Transcription factor [Forsythia ovata]|uniref:Transcription factor n=1 Tax=Forsythia ovata TaxID=205694 RepID=A0ABD1NWH4_9LAMI